MTALHLHTEIRDAHVTVTLIGELDASTAPTLTTFVGAVPVRPEVIDARYLNFVDAAGLRALLAARNDCDCDIVPSVVLTRLIAVTNTDVPLRHEPFGQPHLDDAGFGVAIHDTDLRYVYVNDRLARINGVPAERHLGKLAREIFQIESDDVTDVLRDVQRRHAPTAVTVAGATAAGSPDWWTCDYLPVRWVLDDRIVHEIVAVVEPTSPTESALSFEFTARSEPGV